jgi:hypothetical protein
VTTADQDAISRTALELALAALPARRNGAAIEDLVHASGVDELDRDELLALAGSLVSVIGDLSDDALPGQVDRYLATARQRLLRDEWTRPELHRSPGDQAARIAGRHGPTPEQGAA